MSQFLGFDPNTVSYDAARVVLVPVPYEASVSYGTGTAAGPAAIIDASMQVEFYDTLYQKEYPHMGIFTREPIHPDSSYQQMACELNQCVASILKDRKFPLVLGGEHAISVPAVDAFADRYPSPIVIHFDAHADLRNEYQGNPWSHACAIRHIRKRTQHTVSIGIRSMSSEEADLARTENICLLMPEKRSFWADVEQTIQRLSGPAWLTFDVDCFDPMVIPATGTPEPGGLLWPDIMQIIHWLSESSVQILGADVVELAPIPGIHAPDFIIAKLIHRMILAFC